MTESNGVGPNLPPRAPAGVAVLFMAAALLLLVAAGATAFHTHSENIEKLGAGAAGILLTGKIAALIAAMLLMLQFSLSARIAVLDRVFGLDRLLHFHRYLGATAAVLACIHPLFLYLANAQASNALEWDSTPQLGGAAALTFLCIVVSTSLWRTFLTLSYESWRKTHQLVFFAAIGALVHGVWIGSDVGKCWLGLIWLLAVAGYVALFLWVKLIKPRLLRSRQFTVASVKQLNYNVCELILDPPQDRQLSHFPGQFAFLQLYGQDIRREEHPFTISSSPTADRRLSFTIKASGDFTETIPNTEVGNTATVDGPYGQFSHLLRSRAGESLLFIAGGVGITPILSMLRYIADNEPARPVTLVWGNRTAEDIFARDELEQMQKRMADLIIHHVLSEQPDWHGEKGFVNTEILQRLLTDRDNRSRVFLCGPPPMMTSVELALRALGFPKSMIHSERFSL